MQEEANRQRGAMQGMPDPSAQHHPRPNLMAQQQQQQPNNMPVQANNQQPGGMRPTMGGMPGQPWNQQQNHPGQPQMAGQQGMPQQQGNLNPQQQQQMRMNQPGGPMPQGGQRQTMQSLQQLIQVERGITFVDG